MAESTVPWISLVRQADKDFDREAAQQQVAYEFSGGRKFKAGAGIYANHLTWSQLDNIHWPGMTALWPNA